MGDLGRPFALEVEDMKRLWFRWNRRVQQQHDSGSGAGAAQRHGCISPEEHRDVGKGKYEQESEDVRPGWLGSMHLLSGGKVPFPQLDTSF